ncbi:acyl-CoA carboxylase subunit epsilon [Skermania sp. ID1734]|uniref:acyl-CoA carboxylase epsilon subunit n=1 Tax=Skermania sp. ID1734 TaxID=2597516 RepID=UPI00117C1343|nr:acyl-CoA carboxylase epsilon subunit [Skermania sp. ID1734]TSD97378.1 acyl-CoA carboxylase subunit epsilon [Skermania sp. ID1734]
MTATAEEDVLCAADIELDLLSSSDAEAPVSAADNDPVITVLRGNPTDEDVAVLAVVFAAASGAAADTVVEKPRDNWGEPSLLHRGITPFTPYVYGYLSSLRD